MCRVDLERQTRDCEDCAGSQFVKVLALLHTSISDMQELLLHSNHHTTTKLLLRLLARCAQHDDAVQKLFRNAKSEHTVGKTFHAVSTAIVLALGAI